MNNLSFNRVSVFDRTLQKSNDWIRELHEELHWVSMDSVYHLLRAVLQTLRDQLSIDEAAHLAAQLPLLLRGAFYECWDPQEINEKSLGKDDFIEAVRVKMGPMTEAHYDLEKGILACLMLLKKHVSVGEMEDIVSSLKPTLRSFVNKGVIESQMNF